MVESFGSLRALEDMRRNITEAKERVCESKQSQPNVLEIHGGLFLTVGSFEP